MSTTLQFFLKKKKKKERKGKKKSCKEARSLKESVSVFKSSLVSVFPHLSRVVCGGDDRILVQRVWGLEGTLETEFGSKILCWLHL